YHLGEGAAGRQFTDLYVEYSNILKGFASFVESTIIICSGHDSKVEENVDESSEDSSDGSDVEGDENHSGDKEHEKQARFDLEAALDELTLMPKTSLMHHKCFSLQPADYEAAMSSFLGASLLKSDFGMAASDSNLPPLPPVGQEVPVPHIASLWPQSIEPAGPAPAVAFQPPAFQMTGLPTPPASQADSPPAFQMTGPPTPPHLRQTHLLHSK
ncbi:hypothetical protein DFH29DRAFT_883697, partial [Suillus ampliporus]